MRKNYFLAALATALLSVGSLVAQPTLTYSNMLPQVGLTYTHVSHNAPGLSPGPAGTNQTWNFSQVSAGTDPMTVTIHETAGSPFANTFPGATHYSTNTTDNGKGFISFGQTEYSVRGMITDGGPVFTYTDPQKLMVFPFTYSNSFTDTYASTYTMSGMTINRQGTSTTVADGYGTLVLPNGQTYNNVLRFKMTEQTTDFLMGSPFFSATSENYYWYKLGLPAALFSVVSLTANGQTSSSVISLLNSTVSAPDELANELAAQVYPNPARGSVTIVSANEQAPVTVTLLNNLGQQVRNQTFTATENQLSLDGLAAGVYVLQLQSGDKSAIKKLIVE